MKYLNLGIDLGSVSLKVALTDGGNGVIYSDWMRVSGRPLTALADLFTRLLSKFPDGAISNVGITGSGRSLLSNFLDAVSINEIKAQAIACSSLSPQVRSIIEIGGQDSKFIILEKNKKREIAVKDFQMNELCAAGTGAFLDQQAARLGLSIEDFSKLALESDDPVAIAGRCAVFAKTDMTHHQQEGRPLPDIVAGLNEALVRSFTSNMIRGRNISTPISFQGGVASNRGLVDAFKKLMKINDDDLIISKHHKVMGAIGAAIASSGSGVNKKISIEDILRVIEKKKYEFESKRDSHAPKKRLLPPKHEMISPDLSKFKLSGNFLGIDIGSVSVKLILVGDEGITFKDYRFSEGLPIDSLRVSLSLIKKKLDDLNISISGVGVTGSGRHFVSSLIGADVAINEITAQARAADVINEGTDTIIEIGGQDAKFMRVKDSRPTDFTMNRVCAAGTGAFLQEQAARLHLNIDGEFERVAFESKNPTTLGARCTVFMESDLVSHQQQGSQTSDLAAGLAKSVVLNYFEKVVCGHPVGNKIIFIGGVAENKAVVSAVEAHLGKIVKTSSIGKYSGALGAAFAAFDQKQEGRYCETKFDFSSIELKYEQFDCKDCPNNCRITKTISELPRMFGGRCGKYDSGVSGKNEDKKKAERSPLKKRTQLLNEFTVCTVKGKREKIGIPMALLAYDRLPKWKTFFEELGFNVVVSSKIDNDSFVEGMKNLFVETCLPVKAFLSHLKWLEKEAKCDHLFVPSYVIEGEDKHKRETFHCPYIQAISQLAGPVVSTSILNPVINWRMNPQDELTSMLRVTSKLKVSRVKALAAWVWALRAQDKFEKEIKKMGKDVLARLSTGEIKRAFVILGKDYNVCDPRLNSRASKILEKLGEVVITQDMIADASGDYSKAYRTMYWLHSKEILAAAKTAAQTKNLYPVMISSFGCGPDSFTIKFVKDILKEKPFLLLEVDEHSSSVGMETRVEAFLDSLQGVDDHARGNDRLAFNLGKKVKRVFLPNFSDHGYAFAAAIKTLGIEPVLTALPDDESAKLGTMHSTTGECHPYVLMLGDYIKAASSGDDFKDACYYMPESGACRVGQFGTQMRLVSDELGLKLPIITRVEDLGPSIGRAPRRTYVNALLVYWEMMRGIDFLMQKYFETRAREKNKGSTDAAYEYAREKLYDFIMKGKARDGLKTASIILDSVSIDKSKELVKIGITGDYYTRICDYANSRVYREIERLGGVLMIPPTMTEFVKYDANQKPFAALMHGKIADMATALVVKSVVEKKENKSREIFEGSISYDVPLNYKRAMKLISPYMDEHLPAGLTGSVAAIMEQIDAGAEGILNLITFHCTYGLVLGSILALIEKDHPLIPKLTLIFEGLKPTHNFTRLEAFMEKVWHNHRA